MLHLRDDQFLDLIESNHRRGLWLTEPERIRLCELSGVSVRQEIGKGVQAAVNRARQRIVDSVTSRLVYSED